MAESGQGGWTRRGALAALAATAAAPALPGPAAAPTPLPLPPELARICLGVALDPLPARLGAAAAGGRCLADVAVSLRARLGPGAAADWGAALVASGRRDLARGDAVEVLGRPLMRTEAEVLAAGALLRDSVRTV